MDMSFLHNSKTNRVSFSDDTLPNMKDLYERYYSERDKQISFFWENSKYIWGIIASCFAGYGLSLFKYFEVDCVEDSKNYLLVLIGICVLGAVGSWFLLWMNKATKAWYEVFEVAIWDLESKNNYFGFNEKYLIKKFWKLKDENNPNRMFKSNAFSPSKINIALPIFLIIVWSVLIFIHTLCYLGFDDFVNDTFVLMGIFSIIPLLFFFRKNIKSSMFKPKFETTPISNNTAFETLKQLVSEEEIANRGESVIWEALKAIVDYYCYKYLTWQNILAFLGKIVLFLFWLCSYIQIFIN